MRLVEGLSLGQIQKITGVPKTTIRDWVVDIALTEKQVLDLKTLSNKQLQAGRIKAQLANKEKRIKKEKDLLELGKQEIGQLNSKELLIAGVALYWAEGFKNRHESRLGFCNTDPTMIKFYLHWLEKSFSIGKRDLVARLTLNTSYEKKTGEIERYWSELTGIPLSQFTKPFYQKTIWKKQFTTENYYGVLRIHVKDSLDNLLKMRGWIEGLRLSLPG